MIHRFAIEMDDDDVAYIKGRECVCDIRKAHLLCKEDISGDYVVDLLLLPLGPSVTRRKETTS